MLAKGMDLPRDPVAVLAADGLLHRPDLRAGEQALQLLLQLAGGRAEVTGPARFCPTVHRSICDTPSVDVTKAGEEIQLRREAGLVPFSRACLLRLSGESAAATATAATVVAERIRPLCEERIGGWLVRPGTGGPG